MSAQPREFDFLRIGTAAFVISTILVLGSLVSFAVKGLNLGLDFTGGTLLEISFRDPVVLAEVRTKLAELGQPRASAVHFGSEHEVLIRLPTADSPNVVNDIVAGLDTLQDGGVKLRRTELVGPQMGEEMLSQGGLAVLGSFLMVMLYVSSRFQWKLSVGAVAALVHDVTITLGAFSLFGWEVDLTVLAAVLALIGYSINDTIVVYDRIRENVRKMRRMELVPICNASLNQTLGRTLMTSGVTLLSVIALLLFGGDTLRGFSTAMTNRHRHRHLLVDLHRDQPRAAHRSEPCRPDAAGDGKGRGPGSALRRLAQHARDPCGSAFMPTNAFPAAAAAIEAAVAMNGDPQGAPMWVGLQPDKGSVAALPMAGRITCSIALRHLGLAARFRCLRAGEMAKIVIR